MRSVLRIALAFFSFLPLQRWLNVVGAALVIIGALCALPAASINARNISGLPLMLGVTFIVLTPAFVAGIAMRSASTRMLLRLRPHGRRQMLLAATVAITLMAVLATLPLLLTRLPGMRQITSFHFFAVSWSSAALLWVCQFYGGRSPGSLLLYAGMIGIAKAAVSFNAIPAPDATTWLLLGIAMWGVFCAWYANTPAIGRAAWFEFDHPQRMVRIFPDTPLGRLLARLAPKPDEASPRSATRQYLFGNFRPAQYAVNGVLIVLGFLAIRLIQPRLFNDAPAVPPIVLPLLAIHCWAVGLSAIGGGRLLWLHAGADRTSLFALVERQGLRTAMTTLAAGCIAFILIGLLCGSAHAPTLCLFALSQFAFGICFFYGGLALTRGWSGAQVVLGLIVLFIVQLAAATMATLGYLLDDATPAIISGATLLFILLIPLLRGHARRRWLDLDWRLAQREPAAE